MAYNPKLEFPNIGIAKTFINNTLVKITAKMELRWSNIKIDPLTNKFANISATFHEVTTDTSGKKTLYDGYFTAIAHQTSKGWKLHNIHWSSTPH